MDKKMAGKKMGSTFSVPCKIRVVPTGCLRFFAPDLFVYFQSKQGLRLRRRWVSFGGILA
jgi:hypothetical protein